MQIIIFELAGMDVDYAKRLLLQSCLGLDPDITATAIALLQEHVGLLPHKERDYAIFAAAAMAGENASLPDLEGHAARSGVTVESVMKHIGNRSREEYLEVLTRQTEKWREAPLWLKEKIDHVKMSYRIFKKYRLVFE